MRYAVHNRHGAPLAMLGFSTAVRKLAPRNRFIGWTPRLRENWTERYNTTPVLIETFVETPRFIDAL